ncbi:MAG: glycosyltransferase family 2 protein [Myxococcota bacterium]|nr:glycosyltransferase family 2 protein [Myxococcota bacterium]
MSHPLPIPIIVLAFNKHEMTQRCIRALHSHTQYPYRVILVDNGSSPAFEPSADYDLVRLDTNLYFTGGINAGIRHALRAHHDFEHIVLLNNDVTVTDGWLSALVDAAQGQIGVIGNKQFLEGQNDTIIHAGTVDLIQGVHKGGPDNGTFDSQSREVWITFACALITRPCLEAVGLLDQRMAHFYSDNDYCLRAWMAGYEVVFEPSSKVIHGHHQSYSEASVDFEPDRRVYERKWLGQDMTEKIFNRIFLDFDQRSLMTLNPKVVRKSDFD